MCGIVGVVGRIFLKEENAFKLLTKLDTIRGEHSTGLCFVSKEVGSWETIKDTMTPYDLFHTKDFEDVMKKNHNMMFAHNRAATRGKVTLDNAHPFHHGDFVGCHNGTLNSCFNLKDHKDFEVDSENIYYNMSIEGHLKTIKKLNGAFALCWYNAAAHTVNLVRNNDRPMSYCYSEDSKTLFWASEPWMLHVALEKSGIKRGEILQLPVGKLMTIQVPKVAGGLIEAITHTMEDVEFYKHPTYSVGWIQKTMNTKTSEKGSAKIIPIGGKKQNFNARFLGKIITFSVVGPRKNGNLEFIECQVEEEISDNLPPVRVFTPVGSSLGRLLLDSVNLFSGKVKGFTVYGNEQYFVCDNRTIEELKDTPIIQTTDSDNDFSKALAEMSFTVFENRTTDLQGYLDLTATGCADCGDIARVSDHRDILWVGQRDYFCGKCRNGQFAAQYCAL